MLHNRTWIDPKAEAEFWGHMERLETVQARLAATAGWGGLLSGGLLRRRALQRDLEAIERVAKALVESHTILLENDAKAAADAGSASAPTQADESLRALAGMVVSLRQDRVSRPEAGEEQAV